MDKEKKYYVFTVLPFGLASACYAFTKLMSPLIRHWSGQGIQVVIYLDDAIAEIEDIENATRVSKQIQSDLRNAGLIVNNAKSQWSPTKSIVWLGFQINLELGQLRVPELKLGSLQDQLGKASVNQIIPAKVLASIIGKIVAMSLALGSVTQLTTRRLYAVLNSRFSWDQQLTLSKEATEELVFWKIHMSKFNGQNLWPSPSAVRVVYSDASNTGYGGYCVEHGGHIMWGQWSQEEAQQSSTWWELKAVRLVPEAFSDKLKNQRAGSLVYRQPKCIKDCVAQQQEAIPAGGGISHIFNLHY